MEEQTAKAAVPAPGILGRLLRVLRMVLSITGLLVMGAGVCSGVFCVIAMDDAWRANRDANSIQKQASELAKAPPGAKTSFGGVDMNLPDMERLSVNYRREALEKSVHGYKLLSVSIGLFFGGTTLSLFGWGLRDSQRGRTAR